jgi:sigma-B regulation protein RsbU (phosphoserine phosphatase)
VGVALSNASLYSESLVKRRMEEELAVARQIQFALLPETLPSSTLFEVDAFTRPAREVGGDFYDFLTMASGQLGIVIGDASGKSVPAALMIAQLQAVLKSQARGGTSVVRIMESLNRCAAAGSQSERFVTMVYGQLDPHTGRFLYCNAGHNYPIHVRVDGSFQNLDTGGLLLGVFDDAEYHEGEVTLAPGDVLVFYTDGFTEIYNEEEEEFGEDRLAQSILKNRAQSPQMICQSLMQEVLGHAKSTAFDDDATVVVIKQRGQT